MWGLGWQELVIVAVILVTLLLPLGSLIYLFVDGVRATTCGQQITNPGVAVDPALCPLRQRPVWLVVLLTVVTSGAYLLVWFGVSWAEMKRVVRNPGMSPVGHALSLMIPILGLFRVYAHFQMITRLCTNAAVAAGINPVTAVAAMAAVTVLGIAGLSGSAIWVLRWVAIAITAAVIALGQRALNRIWSRAFAMTTDHTVSRAEWVVLVLWGFGLLIGIVLAIGRATS